MKVNPSTVLLVLLTTIAGCTESKTTAQTRIAQKQEKVGGECEGCEAIYENKTPFARLDWELTLADYSDDGTRINITGIVYRADGKTPAAGIILYFYHTDQSGMYPQGNEKGWGRRHGYIRGWLKTNEKGQYSIKTLKPAAYPNRREPAHIHCIIKEHDLNEYYIGDFLFDDDPLVIAESRSDTNIPGGNGVVKLQEKNGILHGVRNIYLGKNIRNYPSAGTHFGREFFLSGLAISYDCPILDPIPVSGRTKGTKTSPM